MDMTMVLGIFTFFFFVTLSIMCFYRSKINVKLCNTLFIIADLLAYSAWNYASYLKGWLSNGWMTLGNISPLMFTLIILTPAMNEKVKDYVYSAVAFLSTGMFLAMIISPEHDYIFNFNTEATFIYTTEAVAHMVCSLFGIYLVLSHQVKPNYKSLVKAITCTLSIITLGVILNFVFHTRNFGMDPYGNAKIYMLDLFGSFWATLVAYYFGVVMVLIVGMQTVSLLDNWTAKLFVQDSSGDTCETVAAVSADDGRANSAAVCESSGAFTNPQSGENDTADITDQEVNVTAVAREQDTGRAVNAIDQAENANESSREQDINTAAESSAEIGEDNEKQ